MDDDKKKKRTIIIAVIIVLLFLLSSSVAYYLYITKKNGGVSGTGVAQGPAVSFTIKPAVVMPGERAKLVWSTNATACFAVGDQATWFSISDPSSGSTDTQELKENRTYTITCTSPLGTTTKSVTVSVVHPESGGTSTYGAKSPNAGTPIECVDLKKDLGLGSKGDPVSALQRFLATHNFLVSAPSGVYGTSTVAAVKIFQTSQKLSANGSAGLLTRTAVKKISCKWGATPEYTCFDGIKNGDETGVDVGGHCVTGALITCSDGIQNGDETGVDIGGHCKNTDGSGPLYTCYDGIQNGDETGIDIGGHCGNGSTYTCFDGIKNGDETGIDVGGHCGGDIGTSTGTGAGAGGTTPGQCKTARDCANGQACSTTGVCIAAGTCKVAADCGAGQTCSPGGVCTGDTGAGGSGWKPTQPSKPSKPWGSPSWGPIGGGGWGALPGDFTDPSYTPRVALSIGSSEKLDPATGKPIFTSTSIVVQPHSTTTLNWKATNTTGCSATSTPTMITSTRTGGSCFDGVKNGNETDIDLGGRCTKPVWPSLAFIPKNKLVTSNSSFFPTGSYPYLLATTTATTTIGLIDSNEITGSSLVSVTCKGSGGVTTKSIQVDIAPPLPVVPPDTSTPGGPLISYFDVKTGDTTSTFLGLRNRWGGTCFSYNLFSCWATYATAKPAVITWASKAPSVTVPATKVSCFAKTPDIYPANTVSVTGWTNDLDIGQNEPNGVQTSIIQNPNLTAATSTAVTYTIVCKTDKGGLSSKSKTVIVSF